MGKARLGHLRVLVLSSQIVLSKVLFWPRFSQACMNQGEHIKRGEKNNKLPTYSLRCGHMPSN